MKPYYADEAVTLYHGDCIEVMRSLPEDSIDAILTDPPYGLEFMGKSWDSFAPSAMVKRSGWDTAASSARITEGDGKPHGRVAFHKRRSTFQCKSCGKRDGFRNPHPCGDQWGSVWVDRDPVEALAFGEWSRQWATEAMRVLKPGGHLLAFGGTRTWHRLACAIEDAGFEVRDSIAWMYGSGFPKSLDVSKAIDKAAGAQRELVRVAPRPASSGTMAGSTDTRPWIEKSREVGYHEVAGDIPATPAAQQWQGWGTALKPAFEPIVVARKPLTGTVAENVQQWGTGALNIDGCRIGTDAVGWGGGGSSLYEGGLSRDGGDPRPAKGRWPANVILDESQAAELDRQSGVGVSTARTGDRSGKERGTFGVFAGQSQVVMGHDDTGGASRFFYTAKADSSERPRVDGIAHPTVKPLDLMRYLVRLVTPPGGTVLEPFAGSGTTAEACIIEGFRCVAIEITDDYLPLIMQRITKPIEVTLL